MCINLDLEVTGAKPPTRCVTITNTTLSLHSTMNDIECDLVSRKILFYKPRGNTLTEPRRIAVSRMIDVRHTPQCRNQTKELTNKSFSLEFIKKRN